MTTKAQQKADQVAANKRAAFHAKVRTLAGHSIERYNRSAIDAAFDAGMTAENYAVQIASLEPVGRAIHPIKVQAVTHAANKARMIVDSVRKELEAAGWDINAAAPYEPRASVWDRDNQAKKAHHDHLSSFITYRAGYETHRRRWTDMSPQLVDMSAERIERFIKQCEESAAAQYDMFICKLVSKVGEVISASLAGSHVWGNSILTVTKPDGTVENWKTQQIVNYSKFGQGFYQWPSRKMK